jgi:glutamyl-tRNA synthetase
LPLVHDRLTVLSEFDELTAFLYESLEYDAALLIAKNQTVELTRELLQAIQARLMKLVSWEQEPWESELRNLAEELGYKAGDLFMTLRVAITFAKASPPLRESMELLGRDESIRRIELAIKKLD